MSKRGGRWKERWEGRRRHTDEKKREKMIHKEVEVEITKKWERGGW